MNTAISINGSTVSSENYVAWSPLPCQIRLTNAGGMIGLVRVRLKNQNPGQGRQLSFFPVRAGSGLNELELDLPTSGDAVNFFLAGEWDSDNMTDYEASLEVVETSVGSSLSTTPVFVRVRRNANLLSTEERDLFLSALATFNNQGLGAFRDIRDMHRNFASDEAHGNYGFLPWHRAYLLDLERELQNINSRVTLPYWKFDARADDVFTADFMGIPDGIGGVSVSSSNPLLNWKTDNQNSILRAAKNGDTTFPARVLSEDDTIRIGQNSGSTFEAFCDMDSVVVGVERNPHNGTHGSFTGFLGSIGTAPRDPLFFLLHCNVDRLWAKWQWAKKRFDVSQTSTYTHLGAAGSAGAVRIGHNLQDTMWAWNQVTGNLSTQNPRPTTAPGGNFPDSPLFSAPGWTPTIGDMIDYQGARDASRCLGFEYDSVPFDF